MEAIIRGKGDCSSVPARPPSPGLGRPDLYRPPLREYDSISNNLSHPGESKRESPEERLVAGHYSEYSGSRWYICNNRSWVEQGVTVFRAFMHWRDT